MTLCFTLFRSLTVACSHLMQSEHLVVTNTESSAGVEQPLSSVVHGGGEAAITGAVVSESQPAEEPALCFTFQV